MYDIYITGDITTESFGEFAKELTKLEKTHKSIKICLCSDGGDPDAAGAYFDRIQMSKSKITVVGTGSVQSAAVLILVAGEKAVLTKTTWVMMHETSVHKFSGTAKTIGKRQEQLEFAEVKWARAIAEAAGLEYAIVKKWHEYETYMPAEGCFAMGLVDEII